jgi:hypothetical protein
LPWFVLAWYFTCLQQDVRSVLLSSGASWFIVVLLCGAMNFTDAPNLSHGMPYGVKIEFLWCIKYRAAISSWRQSLLPGVLSVAVTD